VLRIQPLAECLEVIVLDLIGEAKELSSAAALGVVITMCQVLGGIAFVIRKRVDRQHSDNLGEAP